jgi:hypothetical protein
MNSRYRGAAQRRSNYLRRPKHRDPGAERESVRVRPAHWLDATLGPPFPAPGETQFRRPPLDRMFLKDGSDRMILGPDAEFRLARSAPDAVPRCWFFAARRARVDRGSLFGARTFG